MERGARSECPHHAKLLVKVGASDLYLLPPLLGRSQPPRPQAGYGGLRPAQGVHCCAHGLVRCVRVDKDRPAGMEGGFAPPLNVPRNSNSGSDVAHHVKGFSAGVARQYTQRRQGPAGKVSQWLPDVPLPP